MKARTIAIAIGTVALLLVAVMLPGARNGLRPTAGFIPAASPPPRLSPAASGDPFKSFLEARVAASSAIEPGAPLSREQIQLQFKNAADARHDAETAGSFALQRKEQGK